MREIIREQDGTYTFRSQCLFCGQPSEVKRLRKRALDRWDMGNGAFVQDAFPQLSAEDREILISGTHGKCFDEEFAEKEEEKDPLDPFWGF